MLYNLNKGIKVNLSLGVVVFLRSYEWFCKLYVHVCSNADKVPMSLFIIIFTLLIILKHWKIYILLETKSKVLAGLNCVPKLNMYLKKINKIWNIVDFTW